MHDQPDNVFGHDSTGALYVVATPIGNLGDITLRALEVLGTVRWIAAEDTRHTAKLLQKHGIEGRLLSLHEHNEAARAERILTCLKRGESVALVSDAGTPCISDPGARLVAAVRDAGFRIVPVPGANAAIVALSAAGFLDAHFLFYGFLPEKSAARKTAIEALRPLACALVFFEAPHRIEDTIDALARVLEPERRLVIARELTKVFESIVCLRLPEGSAWIREAPERRRGEFVLIVSSPPAAEVLSDEAQRTLRILLEELPLKQAVKLAAEVSRAPRNLLYAHALEVQRQRR